MKDELSSLDIHFLLQELKELIGARFQRAYAREQEKELFLMLHQTGKGKQLLRIHLPSLCYLASSKPNFPTTPPGFIMFLRKRLNGTRLRTIEQLGMDRILILTFSKTRELEEESTYKLIIELITPGNIILLGRKPIKGGKLSEEIILSLQQPQQYKDRTVRGGIPYQAPPPAINVKEVSKEELAKTLLSTKLDSIVKDLAIGLNLGGKYAEIICTKAKIDKNAKTTKELATKVVAALKKLLEEKNTYISSEELDEKYSDYEIAVKEVKPRKQKGSILEQQLQQEKGFNISSEQNQRKGELLYEHYQELQPLLEKIKKGEDVKHSLIKKIDRAKGEITLELE